MWIVLVLLGGAVAAMFASRLTPKETKTTEGDQGAGSPARAALTPGNAVKADMILMCGKEPAFCSMQYDPKTCTFEWKEQKYEASGSNSCVAMGELKKSLCATGVSEVPASQWEKAKCQEP
jgi:hypothetical protein